MYAILSWVFTVVMVYFRTKHLAVFKPVSIFCVILLLYVEYILDD